MIFKFKQKPIVLNVYTYRKEIMDLFPFQRIQNNYPEWWKSLDGKNIFLPEYGKTSESNTMKHCAGFTDYYKLGYTTPLWTDMKFKLGPHGQSISYHVSDEPTKLVTHPQDQRGTYLPEDQYAHFKVTSPWMAECDEDVNFAFIGNTWAFDNPEEFIIPPGVVNFKYQKSLNINFFLKYTSREREIVLRQGTPMFNLIPLTEREVKINMKHISPQEYYEKMALYQYHFSFVGNYHKLKNMLRKKEAAASERKCPFGFGK